MDNTNNCGKCHLEKSHYDLLTMVIIRLGDEKFDGARENPGYDVLKFSHAIMYPHKPDFLDTVKQYIDFSENEQLWKEVNEMTGLGESILLEGETRGVDLCAEIFNMVQSGIQDNIAIAEWCGCTSEKVEEIRKKFGI